MIRQVFTFAALSCLLAQAQTTPQATPATPHHEANFETERKQANDLFTATKPLEALPLYEDLERQDPTVSVFAERRGVGLIAKEATITDPKERTKVHLQAMQAIRRAQSLGDNSPYVRMVLDADAKTFVGAVVSGIPLTVGYTYKGKPEAQALTQQADAAFGRSDWTNAAKFYTQAANIDPAWYDPALYAGDTYFRLKDISNAGQWFAKAVAIDPDRETAYRYWGDALFQAGDANAAREKFVEAVVAEPYNRATITELAQWTQRTGHQLAAPAIKRPDFTTPGGTLKIEPELSASTQDGRSSWIVYQQYRVAHGAQTLNQVIVAGGSNANAVVHPSAYQHTIAEEHAALRAMLDDIESKIKASTLTEANLDPSIRNIRALEHNNELGAWIALNAADAGIRADYPKFRSNHRKHLLDYVNTIIIH